MPDKNNSTAKFRIPWATLACYPPVSPRGRTSQLFLVDKRQCDFAGEYSVKDGPKRLSASPSSSASTNDSSLALASEFLGISVGPNRHRHLRMEWSPKLYKTVSRLSRVCVWMEEELFRQNRASSMGTRYIIGTGTSPEEQMPERAVLERKRLRHRFLLRILYSPARYMLQLILRLLLLIRRQQHWKETCDQTSPRMKLAGWRGVGGAGHIRFVE